MGTLVEHAREELDRLRVEASMAATLVAAVGAYASFRPSGSQHGYMSALLVALLDRRPLTELTANPAEWQDMSSIARAPMWMSARDSRAFSADGGRTYTLEDDPAGEGTVYTSVPPPGWIRALRERERDRFTEDAAVEAVWEYLDATPLNDVDRDVLDRASPANRLLFMQGRWGQGAAVAALLYEPPTDPPVQAASDGASVVAA